jgi:hypothetical protein
MTANVTGTIAAATTPQKQNSTSRRRQTKGKS